MAHSSPRPLRDRPAGAHAARRIARAAVLAATLAALVPAPSGAQGVRTTREIATAPVPRAPTLRVTDPRLAHALRDLLAGSPSARAVIDDLARSRLTVTIGTPAQLAALSDADGGPDRTERRALLAGEGNGAGVAAGAAEPPIAWVVFRVVPGEPGGPAAVERVERVERVWLAVEADSVAAWIRRADPASAGVRTRSDYLAILAHEFVAHVGSIAATRRLADFCDDPPATRDDHHGRRRDEARACSIRVENRVRRELNRTLALTGPRRLPERDSYALDVMNFARAYPRR